MRIFLGIVCSLLFAITLNGQDQTLYLNPENAPGIKAATIVDKVDFIPLERISGNFVNNIGGFWRTKSGFAFLDGAANAVLVFDDQGKLLYRYKKKKYKIERINYVASKNALFIVSSNKNYTIPMRKRQQMMLNPDSRNFSKYVNLELLHLDKSFQLEALPVPKYALKSPNWFHGSYLIENGDYNRYLKDTVAYHLSIVSENKVVKSYFPFLNVPKLPTYYEDISMYLTPTIEGNYFVSKQYDHTIFKLTKDSLFPAYHFVFPAALTMPADFQSTQFRNNIEFTDYKNKNKKVIQSLSGIVDLEHLLFFTAIDLSWGNKRYLLNKKNNMLYDLSKLTPDSSIYFLPGRFLNSDEYDHQYLYSYISSGDLLKEKVGLLTKNKNLPIPIKELLDKVNKFDSPILIRIKLKPEIATK